MTTGLPVSLLIVIHFGFAYFDVTVWRSRIEDCGVYPERLLPLLTVGHPDSGCSLCSKSPLTGASTEHLLPDETSTLTPLQVISTVSGSL